MVLVMTGFSSAPFRSATYALIVTLVTFHGRVSALQEDSRVSRRPLSHVTVKFYEALTNATESTFSRGRFTAQALTDSAGRFTLRDLPKGAYIVTMSSPDVPRAKYVLFLDPARQQAITDMTVCSIRFNRACDPPLPDT
jgi:hypothetical protein